MDGKPLPRNWWADRDFALALEAWAMEGDDLVAPARSSGSSGRGATPRRRACRSPEQSKRGKAPTGIEPV